MIYQPFLSASRHVDVPQSRSVAVCGGRSGWSHRRVGFLDSRRPRLGTRGCARVLGPSAMAPDGPLRSRRPNNLIRQNPHERLVS